MFLETGLYFIKNHCSFDLFCTRLRLALLLLAAVRWVVEEASHHGEIRNRTFPSFCKSVFPVKDSSEPKTFVIRRCFEPLARFSSVILKLAFGPLIL